MKKLVIIGCVTLGLMSFDQVGKGKGNGNNKQKSEVNAAPESKGNQDDDQAKNKNKHALKGNSGKLVDSDNEKGWKEIEKESKHDSKEGKKDKIPPGHQKHPEHSNGNAYGKHKDGMTGREFGQHRAEEARNKHKKPETQEEAVTIIEVIHEQNVTLLGKIKDKIEEARDRLRERVRIGDLAETVFNDRHQRIEQLAERQKEIASALFKL